MSKAELCQRADSIGYHILKPEECVMPNTGFPLWLFVLGVLAILVFGYLMRRASEIF